MLRRIATFVAATALLCGVIVVPAAQAEPAGSTREGSRVAPKIAGGEPVVDAATTAPWVVSLWHSRSGSFPDFICTGTVISPDEIVTASHCVQERGYYFVYVGANELGKGTRVAVEAVVSNRSYSEKTFRNDIALLRPLHPITLAAYPRVATASDLRWARLSRPLLQIQGWGDVGMKMSDYLRTGNVILAGGFASDIWDTYDPKTMLATWGQKDETRYTSTCPGDSGGPLFGNRNGSLVLLGVTSWGAADCRIGAPSIFTSVVPFNSWITAARTALPQQAATNNLAKPELIRGAQITNQPRLGSPITCAAEFTRNTSVTYSWFGVGVPAGTTSKDLWVTPDIAGQFVYCTVTARGRLGELSSRTQLFVPRKPEINSVNITGIGYYPKVGEIATCTFTTNTELDTYDFEWWLGTRDKPYTERISTEKTLPVTQDLLIRAAGRQLTCRVAAYAPMGTAARGVYVTMPTLTPPSIRYVEATRNGWTTSSARVGDTLSCIHQITSPDPYTSTLGWYLIPNAARVADIDPMPADAILVSSDSSLAITQQLVDRAAGYRLRCAVSATSWQGTSYRSSFTVSL
jgi:hypothetical protein